MSVKADLQLEFYSHLRDRAVIYLQHWIGTAYSWAGDDAIGGFDCSGLCLEVLQSVGLIKHGLDMTADGLYKKYKDRGRERGYKGCLIFWFNNVQTRAVHVEMQIDNYHTIGASGGGSRTKTIADAIRDNAFVKMRPLGYRGLNYKICDPFAIARGG